jgi:hypothetical protein
VDWQQLTPRGFMAVSQMLFMVDHSCWMVFLFSICCNHYFLIGFCFKLLILIICLIGLPPLVLRRILEILTYLSTNHTSIANMLFYLDPSIVSEPLSPKYLETKMDKGKEKIDDGGDSLKSLGDTDDIPLILFLKLLNRPLFLRSTAHLEQV